MSVLVDLLVDLALQHLEPRLPKHLGEASGRECVHVDLGLQLVTIVGLQLGNQRVVGLHESAAKFHRRLDDLPAFDGARRGRGCRRRSCVARRAGLKE